MRFIPNWRDVLRHAWSIRLQLAAAGLDGLTAALGIDPYLLPVPLAVVAGAAGVVNAAAFLARFVAQKELQK